jgi:excisionase family DNA binding protein
MNLADAIRRASHLTPKQEDEQVTEFASYASQEPMAADDKEALEGLNISTSPGPGLIRLELFLPPDQLHRLIRSVAATQHTVLTLREAAGHLRISTSRLEELAVAREIPAFQVDGKWRFSRARLEEWVAEHHLTKEEAV